MAESAHLTEVLLRSELAECDVLREEMEVVQYVDLSVKSDTN
jgi:hypothetical protein